MQACQIPLAAHILSSLFFILFQQWVHGQTNSGIIRAEQFDLQYVMEGEGRTAIVIGSALYYPEHFQRILKRR